MRISRGFLLSHGDIMMSDTMSGPNGAGELLKGHSFEADLIHLYTNEARQEICAISARIP